MYSIQRDSLYNSLLHVQIVGDVNTKDLMEISALLTWRVLSAPTHEPCHGVLVEYIGHHRTLFTWSRIQNVVGMVRHWNGPNVPFVMINANEGDRALIQTLHDQVPAARQRAFLADTLEQGRNVLIHALGGHGVSL